MGYRSEMFNDGEPLKGASSLFMARKLNGRTAQDWVETVNMVMESDT